MVLTEIAQDMIFMVSLSVLQHRRGGQMLPDSTLSSNRPLSILGTSYCEPRTGAQRLLFRILGALWIQLAGSW